MSTKDRNLSPAETARFLGLSIKALRLYEQRGLVTPSRTEADWRVYGPDQIARLHQIVALKRLGLPLAKIGALLGGRKETLDQVLDLQERVLAREGARVAKALEIVRKARSRLAAGQALSIDDLATLTKETTMTRKASDEEMKAIFDPLAEKHFTAEENAKLRQRSFDQAEASKSWEALIEEAKALMTKGDPYSAAAHRSGAALAGTGTPVHAGRSGGEPESHGHVEGRDGEPGHGAEAAAQPGDLRLRAEGRDEALIISLSSRLSAAKAGTH